MGCVTVYLTHLYLNKTGFTNYFKYTISYACKGETVIKLENLVKSPVL